MVSIIVIYNFTVVTCASIPGTAGMQKLGANGDKSDKLLYLFLHNLESLAPWYIKRKTLKHTHKHKRLTHFHVPLPSFCAGFTPCGQCMDGHKVGVELAVGVGEHSTQFGDQLGGPILSGKETSSGLACGRVTAGAETNNYFPLYLVGSEEQPLQVVVICVDVVPDDWRPLQDRGYLFYRLHRDFLGHHLWTYITQTSKDGGKFALFPPFFVNTCV